MEMETGRCSRRTVCLVSSTIAAAVTIVLTVLAIVVAKWLNPSPPPSGFWVAIALPIFACGIGVLVGDSVDETLGWLGKRRKDLPAERVR